MSSVAVRVDELNRFVRAPVKQRLDAFDRQVSEAAGKPRENYATLQQFRDLQASVSRSTLAEQSLAEQAANLRASLTGLSDEDRALLDRRPAVDGIRDAVNAWDRELRQATAPLHPAARLSRGGASLGRHAAQ